jgi:hypothetical protein
MKFQFLGVSAGFADGREKGVRDDKGYTLARA